MNDRRGASLVVLSFVTLIWAVNFLVAKQAVAEIPPLLLTTVRVVLAGAIFLALAGRLQKGALKEMLAPAVLGIVANQVLFIEGLKRTTPTHSAIVVSLIPVYVALLARHFLQERLGPLRAAGICAACVGVAVVEIPRGGGPFDTRYLVGDGLTLLAALAFAGYTVVAKRLLPRYGPLAMMAGCYLLGAVILAPASVAQGLRFDWKSVHAAAWLDLGYMVLFATNLAYFGHSWALSRIESSRVAIFTCAQPVLAGLCSWLWLHEAVTPPLAIGGALVLAGVALVQLG